MTYHSPKWRVAEGTSPLLQKVNPRCLFSEKFYGNLFIEIVPYCHVMSRSWMSFGGTSFRFKNSDTLRFSNGSPNEFLIDCPVAEKKSLVLFLQRRYLQIP
jgi:hypothetical protein